MKINLYKFGLMSEQRERVHRELEIPSQIEVDFSHDSVSALNELTRALADLHPHKMAIAVLGAQPEPIREIINGFAGKGYSVAKIPVNLMSGDDKPMKEAWEKLKKDTLFVISSVVEPLTGCLYPVEWMRQEAQKKSIFSILYHSPDSLGRAEFLPRNEWEGAVLDPLWGETNQIALILKGDRMRGEKLIWGESHFLNAAVGELISGTKREALNENSEAILKFENKIESSQGEFCKTLKETKTRLYDRAVCFFDGINGQALKHKLGASGYQVFTAAACDWNTPYTNRWLPELGFDGASVESTLIVPIETVLKNDFEKNLLAAVAELRKNI